MPNRFLDPDLTIERLTDRWPETIPVFLRHRMMCVGCLVSPFHTVDDACAEYSLFRSQFAAELAEAVREAGVPRR